MYDKVIMSTFNVCLFREYIDPESESETFLTLMKLYTEMYLTNILKNLIR